MTSEKVKAKSDRVISMLNECKVSCTNIEQSLARKKMKPGTALLEYNWMVLKERVLEERGDVEKHNGQSFVEIN